MRKRCTVWATTSSPCVMATVPARCTNSGAQEVLYSISLGSCATSGLGRRDPAQAKAGHQPGLGEGVGADEAVVRVADLQEGGRDRRGLGRAARVVQALVGIVGEDPDAVPAAVLEDRALRRRLDGPAGGVVGRVHVERGGARGEGSEQLIEIQRPALGREAQRHGGHRRTEDLGNLHQVGPQRGDFDDAVARADHRLGGDHQRRQARAGHGDALRRGRPVQPGEVGGNRLAQLGQAEVLAVEGFAGAQRIDGGLADEIGRDLVGLAEPEGDQVLAAHGGIGHFADARGAQLLHAGAGGRAENGHELQGSGTARILARGRGW